MSVYPCSRPCARRTGSIPADQRGSPLGNPHETPTLPSLSPTGALPPAQMPGWKGVAWSGKPSTLESSQQSGGRHASHAPRASAPGTRPSLPSVPHIPHMGAHTGVLPLLNSRGVRPGISCEDLVRVLLTQAARRGGATHCHPSLAPYVDTPPLAGRTPSWNQVAEEYNAPPGNTAASTAHFNAPGTESL